MKSTSDIIADKFPENTDAFLRIWADSNTRSMSGIDPKRLAQFGRANAEMSKTILRNFLLLFK